MYIKGICLVVATVFIRKCFQEECFVKCSTEMYTRGEVVSKKLEFLENITGYPINVMDDQRIIGPRPGAGAKPEDAEIFVDSIPMDVVEDELFTFFSQIGVIYELRLQISTSGS